MEKLKNKMLIGLAGLALAFAGWLVGNVTPAKLGGSSLGTVINSATSSVHGLGDAQAFAFYQSSSNCAGRSVTTRSEPIFLGFGVSSSTATSTVTGTTGVFQAASSTVYYDADRYGCMVMAGRLASTATASTTVTVTEYR